MRTTMTQKTPTDREPCCDGACTPRLDREVRTVGAMIVIYCRDRHGTRGTLCDACRALSDYASYRLSRCPFGEEKPTCARCPIHCYRPEMRSRIQEVMRYAGPRMVLRHPILSILHQIDSLRRRVALKRRGSKAAGGAASGEGAARDSSARV